MLKSRKGMISPVFKYIFVMVIGAMILIFFIGFAGNMGGVFKKEGQLKVLFTLDDSLTAFSAAGDSHTKIPDSPWPDIVDLEFGSSSYNCNKFWIGDSSPKLVPRPLFTPDRLRGRQMFAWTQSWNFPYKVTNFFFLTNVNTQIYLVYSNPDEEAFARGISSYAPQSVFDHIPKTFDVKPLQASQVMTKSAEAKTKHLLKFVFINSDGAVPVGAKKMRLDIPEVDGDLICQDSGDDCYGEVTFYEDVDHKWGFVSKSMLYGAVMVESYGLYKCQVAKSLSELERITKIYDGKTEKMGNKQTMCTDYPTFRSAIFSFLQRVQAFAGAADGTNINTKAKELNNFANNINQLNEDLAGKSGCSEIF